MARSEPLSQNISWLPGRSPECDMSTNDRGTRTCGHPVTMARQYPRSLSSAGTEELATAACGRISRLREDLTNGQGKQSLGVHYRKTIVASSHRGKGDALWTAAAPPNTSRSSTSIARGPRCSEPAGRVRGWHHRESNVGIRCANPPANEWAKHFLRFDCHFIAPIPYQHAPLLQAARSCHFRR